MVCIKAQQGLDITLFARSVPLLKTSCPANDRVPRRVGMQVREKEKKQRADKQHALAARN